MSLLEGSKEVTGFDTSLAKVIAVGVIGVLTAGVCGYFLNDVLNGALDMTWLIVSGIGFFSVFLLQIFFIKSFRFIGIIALLESIAMTALFLNRFSGALLLAWFLLFIFWLFSVKRGRGEMNNQLQVKFSRVEKLVMPNAFTAFSIFISIIVIWVNGATLTKERFLSLIKPAQPIFQTFLSQNFTFNMTISKFAELMIRTQTGVDISTLPAAAKNMAIDQILNQLKTKYDIPFRSTDTFIDVIYNYLMQWLQNIPKPVQVALPISAALLIFFTVKSITWVLRYAVIVFAYILYEIALASGFSRKALESRSHEIITL
ncbi:MAG: hypothetical protein AAB674_01160 [Patescibacteria group bacterium]